MSENKKKSIMFQRFIWLCTGIAFAIIFMLMDISGSKSFVDFYDGGAVYDVTPFHRTGDAFGMEYRPAEGRFVVLEQEAYKYCLLSETEKEWDYLRMEISAVEPSPILAQIDYQNLSGDTVFTQEVRLYEGENELQTDGVSYAGIYIWIRNQAGAGISFDQMQFREKKLEVDLQRSFAVWLAAMTVYIAVTLSVKKLWKHLRKKSPDWYVWIEFLQGFYQIVGECFGKKVMRISEKNRSRIRTGILLFQILYMQVVMDLGMYESNRYYKVQILVGTLLVFALGVLCYEGKKLERVNWRNPLVWSWTVLWFLACVSDFFVGKRYIFMGYIMFFSIGFFVFVWNHMKRREQIVREFIRAVLFSFIFTGVFCFVCRPMTEGMRYLGSYYRPGMFAMYVLFVWIALLGDIEHRLRGRGISPLVFVEAAALPLAGYFLWRTQSSSGVLPAVFSAVFFVFYQFVVSKSSKIKKKTVLVLLTISVLTAPVIMASHWGLTNLPHLLGTEVVMDPDREFMTSAGAFLETTPVYGAQQSEVQESKETGAMIEKSRILKKLFAHQSLESLTSNRNLYWVGYLRETNLTGHSGKTALWGENRWPHSGFLATMHRYGIFSVIPYTVMVFVNLFFTWKYMADRKKQYGYFLFASAISAFVLILIENLELPFLYLCWMAMYLLMGMNFESEE